MHNCHCTQWFGVPMYLVTNWWWSSDPTRGLFFIFFYLLGPGFVFVPNRFRSYTRFIRFALYFYTPNLDTRTLQSSFQKSNESGSRKHVTSLIEIDIEIKLKTNEPSIRSRFNPYVAALWAKHNNYE